MKHITRAVSVLLVMTVSSIYADTVVDFNTATQVTNNSPNQNADFGMNTTTPTVSPDGVSYFGPAVYGAMNERNIGLWTVADNGQSGARVRMNNSSGNGVDGLFLFKTDAVQFAVGNDSLNASSIFTSQIQTLSSATIRFVVEDGGQFYISESSANFNTGESGNQSDSFSLNALTASWFNYDPSTANGVSAIGTAAAPALNDIDFIGFALFANGASGETQGVNYGVQQFTATAITESATLGLIVAFGSGIRSSAAGL